VQLRLYSCEISRFIGTSLTKARFVLGQRLKQRESAGSDYSNKRQEGKQ